MTINLTATEIENGGLGIYIGRVGEQYASALPPYETYRWDGSKLVSEGGSVRMLLATFNAFPVGRRIALQGAQLTDPAPPYSVLGVVNGSGNLSVRTTNFADLRDWGVVDLTGNNDSTSIVQAAINELFTGAVASAELLIPAGIIAITAVELRQSTTMRGVIGAAGGSAFKAVGTNSQDTFFTTASTSYLRMRELRITDGRSSPTSGRGIAIERGVNGIVLENLQVFSFPLDQIYIGAQSGQVSDCVHMNDIWVSSSISGAGGITLERLDNFALLSGIKSDMSSGSAGYVIRCQSNAGDNVVIDIRGVKHESGNSTPTIYFPGTTRGNIKLSSVVQRTPGANVGGDVVLFDNATAGRITLENITGDDHQTWGSGPAVVHIKNAGSTLMRRWGHIEYATIGSSGRIVAESAGNGIPNGAAFGNVGDTYLRLDAAAGQCPLWVKKSGTETNTGWAPTSPETQSPVFSTPLTVNLQLGNRINLGAMTANFTFNSPTNIPVFSTPVTYDFLQDATGGRTITWSALHKGAWPTGSGTASQRKTVSGYSDGTNIIFQADSGWYS